MELIIGWRSRLNSAPRREPDQSLPEGPPSLLGQNSVEPPLSLPQALSASPRFDADDFNMKILRPTAVVKEMLAFIAEPVKCLRFRTFLEKKYCDENLAFYLDVRAITYAIHHIIQ